VTPRQAHGVAPGLRVRSQARAQVTLPASITAPFEALTVPDATAPTVDEEPELLLHREPVPTPAPARVAAPAPAPMPVPVPVRAAAPAPPAAAPLDATDLGIAALKPSPCETFYGLSEKPFTLSTDPRFFYHSTPHDAVSQRLLTAIRDREGLFVLTGDLGTGKTTLCRVVIEQLDRRTLTSIVTERFTSGEELLRKVLADFGVSRDHTSRSTTATTSHDLISTLRSFVESLASLEARAVVIVDEAQHQTAAVLEQIRTLAEAADASSHLQVVLVGQPSLNALLRRTEYRALQQRVAIRAVLEPIPADEIGDYVHHRLAVAGGTRLEFDAGALALVHRLSNGVPRVMNLLCDRAIARAFAVSAATVDAATIEAAANDLDLGAPSSRARRIGVGIAWIAAVVFGVILGAGLATFVFRDAVARAVTRWQATPSAPPSPARRMPAPLARPSTRVSTTASGASV
jgi:general secretion pathway protein A